MNYKEDTNTIIYIIKEEEKGIKLKDVLYKKLKLSGRLLRKEKRKKNIYVNDKNLSLDSKLRKGDVVKFIMEKEKNIFTPQNIPISVVYEDMDIIIINKQPYMVVHPTKGHYDNTMANGLAYYLNQTNQEFKIRFINRLDMNTSGLLLVGKNAYAQQILSKQMDKNLVNKGYITVVKGVINKDKGVIDAPIGKDNEDDIHRNVVMGGQESKTYYEVVERYRDASLVRLKIETGRTHQIRVHMKHLGYPLIGDELYGFVDKTLIDRQALHAESLSFYKTRTDEKVNVRAELPEDMNLLIKKLKSL